MPQMAPLWWESLFIFFILSFLFMNMIMFFNKNNKPINLNEKMMKINQLKWKW
nr:ATPase subunit 8 [Homoeocerus unipunctatus]